MTGGSYNSLNLTFSSIHQDTSIPSPRQRRREEAWRLLRTFIANFFQTCISLTSYLSSRIIRTRIWWIDENLFHGIMILVLNCMLCYWIYKSDQVLSWYCWTTGEIKTAITSLLNTLAFCKFSWFFVKDP